MTEPAISRTTDRRTLIGLLIFAVGTALCAFWAYAWYAPFIGAGSGGIGAVSVGYPPPVAVLALLGLFVPQLITFRLTKRSGGGRLGAVLRWSHLFTSVALPGIVVLEGLSDPPDFPVFVVAALLYFPTQVFFVNAAVALRIARSPAS